MKTLALISLAVALTAGLSAARIAGVEVAPPSRGDLVLVGNTDLRAPGDTSTICGLLVWRDSVLVGRDALLLTATSLSSVHGQPVRLRTPAPCLKLRPVDLTARVLMERNVPKGVAWQSLVRGMHDIEWGKGFASPST